MITGDLTVTPEQNAIRAHQFGIDAIHAWIFDEFPCAGCTRLRIIHGHEQCGRAAHTGPTRYERAHGECGPGRVYFVASDIASN